MVLRLLAVAVTLPLVASAPECPAGSIPGKHGVAACCPAACGHCGGRGCEERAGGREACCAIDIQKAGRPCAGTAPPCVPQGRVGIGEVPIRTRRFSIMNPISLRDVTWRKYTSAVTSILSFVSSSVHFNWCTVNEDFQVRRMEQILSRTRDRPFPSHCIDVGMNDGFYTMLMAASGCIVNSFEVQPLCVDIAHVSLEKNDFRDNVTIHSRPVSDRHEEELVIQMGRGCDGGFNIRGKLGQKMGHLKEALDHNVSFRGIALDSLIMHSGHDIKLLKIDTEGHDFKVLSGALRLIRSRKIEAIFMEMLHKVQPRAETNIVTSALFSSGYRATFIGRTDCGVATDEKTFWAIALHKRNCVDVLFEKILKVREP